MTFDLWIKPSHLSQFSFLLDRKSNATQTPLESRQIRNQTRFTFEILRSPATHQQQVRTLNDGKFVCIMDLQLTIEFSLLSKRKSPLNVVSCTRHATGQY